MKRLAAYSAIYRKLTEDQLDSLSKDERIVYEHYTPIGSIDFVITKEEYLKLRETKSGIFWIFRFASEDTAQIDSLENIDISNLLLDKPETKS